MTVMSHCSNFMSFTNFKLRCHVIALQKRVKMMLIQHFQYQNVMQTLQVCAGVVVKLVEIAAETAHFGRFAHKNSAPAPIFQYFGVEMGLF